MKTATKTSQLIEKATDHAKQVTQNSQIYCYENDGLIWIAVKDASLPRGFRTLTTAGLVKAGIKLARKAIDVYFEDK